MTIYDLIFLILIVGLPSAVSFQIFRNEPAGRPFVATFVLAVVGSLFLFWLAAFFLAFSGVGGLGMFDGLFLIVTAPLIALSTGVVVRRRRGRNTSSSL